MKLSKIKSSTLIENIVSLVIILLVFMLSINIISKRNINHDHIIMLISNKYINQILFETIKNKEFKNKDTTIKNIKVYRKCTRLPQYFNLIKVDVGAEYYGNKIIEKNIILFEQ